MNKVIVTGGSGQLGKSLKNILPTSNNKYLFFGSKELDITDKEGVFAFFDEVKPDFVINCAAYTAVDDAEDNFDDAMAINGVGVENLASACKKYNTKLIHISTDYVFNGKGNTPLLPNETTAPIGVYGSTKLAGEEAIAKLNIDALIIRTSWLYDAEGKNFLNTILFHGANKEELSVVMDQVGCPTYCPDLSDFLITIIEKRHTISGVKKYHFSNLGVASWYDFAIAIKELSGLKCTITPVGSEAYPTKATRPHYSVMSTASLRNDFQYTIPYWKDSLAKCLKRKNY